VQLLKGDLPLVIDVEEYDFSNHKNFVQDLQSLAKALTMHYACKPILYSHQHFYNKYLHQSLPNYLTWIAKYDDEKPVLKSNHLWQFWQYTDKGRIKGIPFYLDMNCFNGDLNALHLLCKK
jgi:lysozyme